MILLPNHVAVRVVAILIVAFVFEAVADRDALVVCIRRSQCNRGPAEIFNCIESAVSPSETMRFVQVGANDGKMLDPLHPIQMKSVETGRRWIGVFVEPVNRMMDALKSNKANLPGAHFVRAVVSQKCVNGSIEFFQLNPAVTAHQHFQGMGGLIKPKRAPDAFVRVSLPCIGTADLAVAVNEVGASQPHILLVDIEGHDISFLLTLEQWPFGKPLAIAFEVWEAPGKLPQFQIQHMFRFLNSHGYIVLKCGKSEDYIALQQMDWP